MEQIFEDFLMLEFWVIIMTNKRWIFGIFLVRKIDSLVFNWT